MKIEIGSGPALSRKCGDCQLCCKLLPVKSLAKDANTRCKHQRHGKGCAVYRKPGFPMDCALWNCRWLVDDATADLKRPDRSHYVIDIMPDYVTVVADESGEKQDIPVLQIWCDPAYPNAHRDPALRAYIEKMGEEGYCALVRYSSTRAIFLAPPNIPNANGEWFEHESGVNGKEHTMAEKMRVLG